METLANNIAKLCLKQYNALGKTGKPTTKEWTILSGIVLKKENEEISLVALATGTKCLGESQLMKLKAHEIGSKLSDSHAETLTRRAFLRYLYEQIDLLLSDKNTEILYFDDNKQIRLKNGISFHFYTTQTPCGDCSIFSKTDLTTSMEPFAKLRRLNDENDNEGRIIKDIYRTGAKCLAHEVNQDPHLPGENYHVVGPLRTKPGRGDLTLSLSCSDKMAKWNILGLQGALLSHFIPTVKIQSLIIAGGCPFSLDAMKRGLYQRFGIETSELKIIQVASGFEHRKGMERTQPCPSSIIWCNTRKRNTEISVEGRKQGATKKKGADCLLVSRRALFQEFLRICDKYESLRQSEKNKFHLRHPKKITYLDCKMWSNYYSAWTKLKSDIFSSWPNKPLRLQSFVL